MEEGLPLTASNEGHGLTQSMRRFILIGIIGGASCIGVSYLAFIIYWTWQGEGWVKDIVKQHFPATVGLPLAAVGSFLLVTVLQISSGKIEFEAWGFKVRGASGPAILWVLCFLSIATGVRLLWGS
jgi:hypothetical protein